METMVVMMMIMIIVMMMIIEMMIYDNLSRNDSDLLTIPKKK